MNLTKEEYKKFFNHMRKVSRDEGVDKVMKEHDLDVIIGPGDSFMSNIAAASGEYIRILEINPDHNRLSHCGNASR
jgi:amidase